MTESRQAEHAHEWVFLFDGESADVYVCAVAGCEAEMARDR